MTASTRCPRRASRTSERTSSGAASPAWRRPRSWSMTPTCPPRTSRSMRRWTWLADRWMPPATPSHGYKNRGSRMFERHYECLYYLCGKIPSTQTPGRTVLDETHRANVENPTRSGLRLMERQGERHATDGPLDVPRRRPEDARADADPRGAVAGTDGRRVVQPRDVHVRLLVLLGLHLRVGPPTFPDRVPALPGPLRHVRRQAAARADDDQTHPVQRVRLDRPTPGGVAERQGRALPDGDARARYRDRGQGQRDRRYRAGLR